MVDLIIWIPLSRFGWPMVLGGFETTLVRQGRRCSLRCVVLSVLAIPSVLLSREMSLCLSGALYPSVSI